MQDPKHNTSLAQGCGFGRRDHPGAGNSLAGGVALVATGLIALLTAHRWRRATARYERDPAAAPADQWKAIDAGEDPTL